VGVRLEFKADKLLPLPRTLFGLKTFEARPEAEARRRFFERRKLLRQLKGVMRRELPESERVLREQLEEE
jgi:hypothetical protein